MKTITLFLLLMLATAALAQQNPVNDQKPIVIPIKNNKPIIKDTIKNITILNLNNEFLFV